MERLSSYTSSLSSTFCTLEITVISGEGLSLSHRQPVRKKTYVTVRTDAFLARNTEVDTEGGSHPFWNEKLVIDMPNHANYITVEVHCKTFNGNKLVGMARIPTTDFRGGYIPENYQHFLSYRLRDSNGQKNGIINLSVRVKMPENAGANDGPIPNPTVKFKNNISTYQGIPVAGEVSGGTVTGVPVWSCKLHA